MLHERIAFERRETNNEPTVAINYIRGGGTASHFIKMQELLPHLI